MKKYYLVLLFPVLFFVLGVPTRADTLPDETYSIHIIKYRLNSETDVSNVLPVDGTKRDGLMDSQGNELKTMSDVHYDIIKLQLKEGATDLAILSSYEPVSGSSTFSMSVMTNSSGEATVNGLPSGMYQVTEVPNDRIAKVMDPVLVSLPMTTAQGTLSDVYIYPKSSVSEHPVTQQPSTVTKIPQTSGSIGTNHRLLLLLGVTVVMGIVGIVRFKRRTV